MNYEIKLQIAQTKRETAELINQRFYWGYVTGFAISLIGFSVYKRKVDLSIVERIK